MGIKYILTVVKPSPLFLPRMFSSSPMETLHSKPIAAPISPWEPPFYFVSLNLTALVETVSDFMFLGSKITADGDCSHEIKRRLLLGRKLDQPRQHIQKQRHYFAD